MVKLKKWLATAAIISLMIPNAGASASYNTNSAQTYLSQHSDNPWSVMALTTLGQTPASTSFLASVSGKNAIDYEAPILAITALGQNPRTFGSTDYIAALKSYHASGQIGDASTINDDIFGILALASAGEPVSDSAITDAKNFILSRQNNNGGWGFTATSDSDTNMTASAILALLAAGTNSSDSRIQSATSFLHNSQNSDGGFPYSPNTASDSSSTAWVIWALNALNINHASWNKSNNTPILYLESNQSDQGYFKYQPDSSEDSFSAITTAYAAIALQGKYLPVRVVSGSNGQEQFSFRIEGSAGNICSGETSGPTALDIIKNAKDICGYAYNIKDTSFGPYLEQINNDMASGNIGWMYLVNNLSPNVGAADYKLQANDSVLWYFGDFGWVPARLSLSAGQINSGQSAVVTVEAFNDNLWSPLSGATVYFGADTAATDSNGQAAINPRDGFYKVYAQKQGYIRSNASLLKVGQASSSAVNLSVNIDKTNQKPDNNTISFTVNPNSIDFGKLAPGASSTKSFTIANNGTTGIHVESIVSGDAVFTQNLKLNSMSWENFKTDIAKDKSQSVDASLSIPSDYPGEGGAKSGQLTVWAMAE
ncbi:MAG: DUF4430 domain-containing protein [Minisyncoccia bacterium]